VKLSLADSEALQVRAGNATRAMRRRRLTRSEFQQMRASA
jgi:hypothetical protein